MLTVTQRPDAYLYENNPPEYGEDPYYYSRWSSAHLPLVYKIITDKSPSNSFDDTDNYTNVYNNKGYARFDLSGSYQTYIVGEKVTVTGSVYDGVYEVKEVVAGEYVTLDVVYVSTDSGTIVRYYENYQILIKLYAGIPPTHPLQAQDPLSYIGTFAIAPNPSNIAIIDVAELVRQKISQDNDIEGTGRPNDLNAWTSFYIQYAETYDVYVNSIPETYTSDYETDVLDSCTTVSITNGTFASNLNGWSQVNSISGGGYSLAFAWNSGAAKITASNQYYQWSKLLYQEVNFIANKSYRLTLDWAITINTWIRYKGGIQIFATDSLSERNVSDRVYYYPTTVSHSESVYIDFTLTENKRYIVIYINLPVMTSAGNAQVNTLTLQEQTSEDCKAYIFAHNGTRQFFDLIKNERTINGGNMAEYVMNYNTQQVLGKFLTRFETPTIFDGKYFDLSCILPQNTLDIPFTEDGLLYRIKQYNNGSLVSTTDTEIENSGDGVYRLRLDDKITQESATVQLIRTETNVEWFSAYVRGDDNYYIGDFNSFTAFPTSAGYGGVKTFVYGDKKAIILANSGAGRIEIYSHINGVSTNIIGGDILFNGNFLYALDDQNLVVANSGTSGTIVTIINNNIKIESIGFNPYVRGVVMSSDGTIYIIAQAPYNTTYIYKRISESNWVQEYSFSFEALYNIGDTATKIAIHEDVLYIPYHYLGEYQILKYPLATGQGQAIDVTTATDDNTISVLDEDNILATTAQNLFIYDGVSFTRDTAFDTIRTTNSDSTNINSVAYEGIDLIRVTTGDRIYTKQGSTWTTGVGGSYSAPNNFLNSSGRFLSETVELLVSEEKELSLNTDCSRQSVYLSWISSLGNWEFFLFTARKGYEKVVDNVTTTRRNIYASFPDNWTSETEDDKIRIESYDRVTVRSQYVTKEQLDVIAEIITSIRVQAWYLSTEKITVIVDTKKINKYTDGDKLYAIEFDIIYPQNQTLGQ